MNSKACITIAAITFASMTSISSADILFSDNFESGLNQWTGKNGGSNGGALVIDPFDNTNTVLSFNRTTAAGDIFTANALTFDPNETYRLSFDYLGLAQEASNPNDTGGYVGFAVDMPGRHSWQWATGTVSGANDVLIDDGQWRNYNFEFTTADLGIGNSLRLMLEDFSGSRGTFGDAYFDNIQVSPATVPAPGAIALLGIGGLITARRRRA